MTWLAAILLLALMGALLWAVILIFGRRKAIETATLDMRIAIEFAADRDFFRDAGVFITTWARGPNVARKAFPEFEAYRIRRIREELEMGNVH